MKTGIAIHTPPGTYGRVAPRSGLAVNHFIDVGAGVIDEDYRGEVRVLLFNHEGQDFKGGSATAAWWAAAVDSAGSRMLFESGNDAAAKPTVLIDTSSMPACHSVDCYDRQEVNVGAHSCVNGCYYESTRTRHHRATS